MFYRRRDSVAERKTNMLFETKGCYFQTDEAFLSHRIVSPSVFDFISPDSLI